MKISKTLVNEILKLSKADWEKVKINIDYLFAKEEKNRNKTLYITEDSLKIKADYYPCYMEIEDTEKKGSILERPDRLRGFAVLKNKREAEK